MERFVTKMHKLIADLFKKIGIEKIEDLSVEEKKDFERWQKTLSEGEVTVDKILEFCRSQVKLIEVQWKNLDNDSKKNDRLIILHTTYSTLINLITGPKSEKESLESYLNQLLQEK